MKRRSFNIRTLVLIGIILFLAIACEEEDSTINKKLNIDGLWTGFSSQNENISFAIYKDTITYFSGTFKQPNSTTEYGFAAQNLCSITNNSFYFFIGGSTLSISGTFSNDSTAEGTFDYKTILGTWTIKKLKN